MRTLVVATEYPWPRNSGSRLRLATTLAGLRVLGDVDLFSAVIETRTDFAPPPDELGLDRVERITIDDRPPAAGDYIRAIGRPWAPFELPLRNQAAVRRAVARFAFHSYDLVWYFQVRSWVLAGSPASARSVVDIDDLEDQKILARLSLPRDAGHRRGPLRTGAARVWTQEDAHRWRRLHRRIARRCGAAVVCSDLDAARSGLPGVRVIPNGYPPPPRPVGRTSVSSPPVVLFQGTLRYPPNADAARFLVTDVGPRLRALVPDAEIRLVGLAPPALHRPGGSSGRDPHGPGPRHHRAIGPGRRGGHPAALRQRDPGEDPRGLRPPDPGRLHQPGRRGSRLCATNSIS